MRSNWLIVDVTFAVLLSTAFAMVNKDDCAAMKAIRIKNGYDWTTEANRWVKDPSTHDTIHTCHVNTKDTTGPNRQWWGYVLCSGGDNAPQPVKCGWAANVKLLASSNPNEGTTKLPSPQNPAASCHQTGNCECKSGNTNSKGEGLRARIDPHDLDSKGHAVSKADKDDQECADRPKDAKKAQAAMTADPEFPPTG